MVALASIPVMALPYGEVEGPILGRQIEIENREV